MSFQTFVLTLSCVGLVAAFTAVGLWRREAGRAPSWLISRAGMGATCLFAGGAALVAGGHYRLSNLTWWEIDVGRSLSWRFVFYVATCLVLIGLGTALRALARPAGNRVIAGRGVFTWSVAVALLVTLAELYASEVHDEWLRSVPCVELDTRDAGAPRSLSRDYDFGDHDWVARACGTWQTVLAPYKGRPDVRYLEIGMYQGRSFLWMAENILTHPTAHLTGIDPFLDPLYDTPDAPRTYKEVFYSNLKASGIESKVDIIEGFSQIELRRLPLASYDFIYIDGSHNSADVLEDGVLCWRLLKDGGLLIFDDYQLNVGMKRAIDTFFTFFANDFEPVHVGWQVILRKKARDRTVPGPWE